jgi:hypothetical protein
VDDFTAQDVDSVDEEQLRPLAHAILRVSEEGSIRPRAHSYMHEVSFEQIPCDSQLSQSFAAHGVYPVSPPPSFEEVADYRVLMSPLDVDFHVKQTFVAGSIHDPAVQPFILRMCAGHPLGGLCGSIAMDGLDLPSFFAPWGGEFFGKQYPVTSSPPKARFRNSAKCSAVCADGRQGWSFIQDHVRESEKKGVIAFVRGNPHIVNGLTLEPVKPRMCMASIWLNLWSKLPYSLHFGGLKALTDTLNRLSLVVTFDALQAFNHVLLTERSLPYACFQVPGMPMACFCACGLVGGLRRM